MKKKILLYIWDGFVEQSLKKALANLRIPFVSFEQKMIDYHADSEFAKDFIEAIHRENVDAILSYNYFPLIAMICEVNRFPYLSWIFDCPLSTLQSKTIVSPYNYIFCFDQYQSKRVRELGAKHSYAMPLAGDIEVKSICKENDSYHADISFVGSLYNGSKNRIRAQRDSFSERGRGYLDGLIESQLKVYGYNFIYECLDEQILEEVVKKCNLSLNEDMFFVDTRRMVANAIGMEVTACERERLLHRISKEHELVFYTSSEIPERFKGNKLHPRGRVDYEKEMPLVFYNSKINLNLTSCTIESGIPLRVFDILACGGFCLTNYRAEIEGCFRDGEELVIFESEEDMMAKIEYYLKHEEERRKIALQGRRAIRERHTFESRIREMLRIAFGG